jgi:small subunit ribosomal protein S9
MVEEKKEEKPKKTTKKRKPRAKKTTTKKKEEAKEAPKKEEPPKTEVKEAPKPAPVKPQPVEKPVEKPKPKRKTKSKKKQKKVFVARGKRKESVARATIQEGKGVIRINSLSLTALSNRYVKEIIREPLRYVGPEANSVDISVNVYGGGSMGQAQAARTAIAKALTMFFEDQKLKEKFISIDRSLVIEDTRRVERKKYCGPKARARYQKSYR